MNEPTTDPFLYLRSQINQLRIVCGDAFTHARMSFGLAMQAGGLLAECRPKVPHGQWLPFVAEVGISDQTARNYIRLWEHRDQLKSQNILNLTDAYAATLPERSSGKAPLTIEELDELKSKIEELEIGLIWLGERLVHVLDEKLFKHPECGSCHTFSEYCRKAEISPEHVQMAVDLFEAVQAAHEADDPEILVQAMNNDLRMRVVDFCIAQAAKAREEDTSNSTTRLDSA